MKLLTFKKDSSRGLQFLDGINRPICPAQVTKLAKSVNKMGCIRPVVVAELDFITGKKEKYIIDGQHLTHALIRNSADIPYVIIEIKDMRELVENIALLNASSKSWSMLDYMTAWCALSDDYKKLRRYRNTYDIDLCVLSSILSNYGGTTGGGVNSRLKRGDFKIIEEEKNLKIINELTEALKIIKRGNRNQNKYFCTEYVSFVTNKGASYNHKLFLKKLADKKQELLLVTQEEGKLCEIFENL